MSELVSPDFDLCQTDRPSTWPHMPSFMTLGPVIWTRCKNRPMWIATDTKTGGSMTLCDECRRVMEGLFEQDQVKLVAIGARIRKETG
jgi:hypothetical protein